MMHSGCRCRIIVRWVIALGLLAGASAANAMPRVSDYQIRAQLFPDDSRIAASATVMFDGEACTDPEITFYLHGELDVQSVSSGGSVVPFDQEKVFYEYEYSLIANRVTIACRTDLLAAGVTIEYSGPFHPSRARSISDFMRIDSDGAFLRSYGYSLWFPVLLEARSDSYRTSFSSVVITTPAEFAVVFTGRQETDSVEGVRRVSVWKGDDIDLADAQLTAARFRQERRGDIAIHYLDDPISASAGMRMAAFGEQLVNFYRRHYREEVTAAVSHVVEMPRYGNTANGNVVGISASDWRRFEPGVVSGRLIAHELVHAYVQPPVSRDDPIYSLVIEGFPSYFYLPALADMLGEDAYRDFFDKLETSYLAKKATGRDSRGRILPKEKPLLQISADEIGVYKDVFVLSDRALLFLSCLRRRMGPVEFLKFSRRLLSRDSLSVSSFRDAVLEEIPDFENDLRLWLETNEYPDRWRLRHEGGSPTSSARRPSAKSAPSSAGPSLESRDGLGESEP